MRVLGVDPGSRVTGYGLLEKRRNRLVCIDCGRVTLSHEVPFHVRIHHIYQFMVDLMERHRPDDLAIEDVFYAKNIQSSLKLGHARGAVLIAAVQCGVKIFEYTPLEIKKAVVGYGRAGKEQVRSMVQLILGIKPSDMSLDTSDALASAICHVNWARYGEQ